MELISPSLRNLWKEWDLRLLVLVSLTLQIILIMLGGRRKYSRKLRITIVVWLAYLSADAVATCALGVLSNNLADIVNYGDKSLNPNIELTALWAPILLLHLGGPDTITAYALEDNELWLRHFLGLAFQTGLTCYVLFLAWTSSYLSVIFIIILLSGFIKYGERTWVLRSVSNKKLGESTQDYRDLNPANSYLIDEKKIEGEEGYIVEVEEFCDSSLKVDFLVRNDKSISDEDSLRIAFGLLNLTKCYFLDAILNSHDKETTLSVFRNISVESAFKVIEIELGFTFDLFYTKAPLLYTRLGLGMRMVTFFLTCLACSLLMLFTLLDHKHKYSKIDISITFILLVMAIILEIYSALMLVSSDRFLVWLSMQNEVSSFQALSYLPKIPLFKSPSWSNIVPQYSFLSFSLKEKPLPYKNALKLLKLHKMLEKSRYIAYEEVHKELKDFIFRYIGNKARGDHQESSISREAYIKGIGEFPNLKEELGKSILFWHIVTEVMFYLEITEEDIIKESEDAFVQLCRSTKQISEYMLYLLVVHPSMLSTGRERFKSTVNVAEQVFSRRRCPTRKQACEFLIESIKDEKKQELSGSNLSMLSHAMSYANKLMANSQQSLAEKWEIIREVWLEILTYAAATCNRNQHAQQLRNGGEFLTHVWLLMAHFGLTDHFQIPRERDIRRLIVK